MASENARIAAGDTVAIWGCRPVGLLAIESAYLLGTERVIAIDRVPERHELARTMGTAETIDYTEDRDVVEALKQMTDGRGPDFCIAAVGLEAHGTTVDALYDRAKEAVRLGSNRPHALRQAIQACRKGGTVSITGVYGGFLDKMPMGAAFDKGLTFTMGQTHVHRYLRPVLDRIRAIETDPSFTLTHRIEMDEAPAMYKTFRDKADGCIKVVIRPGQWHPLTPHVTDGRGCPRRRPWFISASMHLIPANKG